MKIRINDKLEGYDLITDDKSQSHDGDGAGEWIATVYDKHNAEMIKNFLESRENL